MYKVYKVYKEVYDYRQDWRKNEKCEQSAQHSSVVVVMREDPWCVLHPTSSSTSTSIRIFGVLRAACLHPICEGKFIFVWGERKWKREAIEEFTTKWTLWKKLFFLHRVICGPSSPFWWEKDTVPGGEKSHFLLYCPLLPPYVMWRKGEINIQERETYEEQAQRSR